MASSRYISPPSESEGAALASVETLVAEGGRGKKGKKRVINKNAYEADGVWVAEVTVEEEEYLDEKPESELQPSVSKRPDMNDLEVYEFMNFVAPLRPIEIDMPAPSAEPPSALEPEPDFTATHNPEPDIALNHYFGIAETDKGQIPVLDQVLDLAVQEKLAHEARIAQEYTALRHKILMEELATLAPKPDNDDLKPEPSVAA